VFEFDPFSRSLLVSCQCESGHGVRKISTLDTSHSMYLPLHTKPIRDLRVCPSGEFLLTASQDKQCKLVSTASFNVVAAYEVIAPAWSCCWSEVEPSQFFVGTQNGQILCFDTKSSHGSSPLFCLQHSTRQPVHSIAFVRVATAAGPCGNREGNLDPPTAATKVVDASASVIGIVTSTFAECLFWNLTAFSKGSKREALAEESLSTSSSATLVSSDSSSSCTDLSFTRHPEVVVLPRQGLRTCVSHDRYSGRTLVATRPFMNQGACVVVFSLEEKLSAELPNPTPETHTQAQEIPLDFETESNTQGSLVFVNNAVELSGHESSSTMCRACIFSVSQPGKVDLAQAKAGSNASSDCPCHLRVIAAAGDELNNTVRLWDVKTSQVLGNLGQHPGPVLDVRCCSGRGWDVIASVCKHELQLFSVKRPSA